MAVRTPLTPIAQAAGSGSPLRSILGGSGRWAAAATAAAAASAEPAPRSPAAGPPRPHAPPGGPKTGGARPFRGLMGAVRLYDTALAPEEVARLYVRGGGEGGGAAAADDADGGAGDAAAAPGEARYAALPRATAAASAAPVRRVRSRPLPP